MIQRDKIELCPDCGSEDQPKYIGDRIPLNRRLTATHYEVFCSSAWHRIKREKIHAFDWECEGWERVNRYGETVKEPEAIGATVKEIREILREGLKVFIDRIENETRIIPKPRAPRFKFIDIWGPSYGL